MTNNIRKLPGSQKSSPLFEYGVRNFVKKYFEGIFQNKAVHNRQILCEYILSEIPPWESSKNSANQLARVKLDKLCLSAFMPLNCLFI